MRLVLLLLGLLGCGVHVAQADITTSLVAWWRLDAGSGTSLTDSSGNAHTGTLATSPNTPTWTSGANCLGGGNCLAFSPKQWFTFTSITTTTTYTISAVIYITAVAGEQRILGVSTGNSQGFYTDVSGGLNILANWNGSQHPVSTGTFPAQQWTHVVITCTTGPTVSYYINGVAAGAGLAGGGSFSAGIVGVGSSVDTQDFNGRMKNVRLYSRTLSPTDVGELFAADAPGAGAAAVKHRARQY